MRSSEIWSHPNRSLIDHLHSVAQTAKELAQKLPPAHSFSSKLPAVAWLSGMIHDYAKATTSFQDRIRGRRHNQRESQHSQLSALVSFQNLWEYLKMENEKHPESNLPLFGYLIVKRHHGNLASAQDDLSIKDSEMTLSRTQLGQIDTSFVSDLHRQLAGVLESPIVEPDEVSEMLATTKKRLRAYKKLLRRRKTSLLDAMELSCLYSFLIDADKLEASGAGLVGRDPLPDDFILKHVKSLGEPETEINKLRTKAFYEVLAFAESISLEERMMSLTLPTGLGKTYSVVAMAQRLRDRISREEGYIPRIVYSLPFTSIIDQNWADLFSILGSPPSSVLLKHHHLGDTLYRTTDIEEEYDYNESGLLIEGWNSEITVTTFVQLFFTLAGFRNRTLRRYHNLAGAIVILDEVQSVPHKYWLLFRRLAKTLSEAVGTRFILVTATQPSIFEAIPEAVPSPDAYFSCTSRVEFDINLERLYLEEFTEDLLEAIREKTANDVLIILNTKRSAELVFSSIKNEGVDADLEFLSTSIIPCHRMERISRLRDAPSNNRIAVSTQIVEAGVDIDFSRVVRDFAPLDSIVQAAGRCNRNMRTERGLCSVRYLIDDRTKRAYSSYIYDSTLLDTTKDVLEKHAELDDRGLHRITNEYFNAVDERKSQEESKRILDDVAKLNYRSFRDVKLIEERPWMTDIFVEYDSEASDILSQYKKLVESSLPRFKKRTEFLKIRRELMKYVISVPADTLGAVHQVGDLICIPNEDIERRYDKDTGYNAASDSAYIL